MLKLVSMLCVIVLFAGSSLNSQEIIVAKQGNLIEACNLIGSSFIKNLMKNERIIVISKKYTSSTSCIFDWEKSNADEINKKNDTIKAEAEANGEKVHLINKFNNITVTFEKRFPTPAEAETEYINMIHSLEKGVISETNGFTQLITALFDKKADNIGEMNAWSSQLYQLSVKSGKYLYHVKVSASDDMNKNFELSKLIAEEIEKKLKTL
jgi:hypothetical protein